MDEFDPCPTATHEMIQRIDVLKARIAGYDVDRVEAAEMELAAAHDRRDADQKRLDEWLDIAKRSA